MSAIVNSDGERFINFKSDHVFVLIKKTDRDWEYSAWVNDHYIGGTVGGASMASEVEHASESLAEIAGALTEMSGFLRSYMASRAESDIETSGESIKIADESLKTGGVE